MYVYVFFLFTLLSLFSLCIYQSLYCKIYLHFFFDLPTLTLHFNNLLQQFKTLSLFLLNCRHFCLNPFSFLPDFVSNRHHNMLLVGPSNPSAAPGERCVGLRPVGLSTPVGSCQKVPDPFVATAEKLLDIHICECIVFYLISIHLLLCLPRLYVVVF